MRKSDIDLDTTRSWCELSETALRNNLVHISEALPKNVIKIAVIKANAYGHGASWVAKIAKACGYSYLAVATVQEGIQLRDAGIETPILVLSPYHPGYADYLLQYNITQTICSEFDALALKEDMQDFYRVNPSKNDLKVKVHFKIDSGMNRIGFSASEEKKAETVDYLADLILKKHFDVEGIFTHFSVADEPENPYTQIQFRRFMAVIDELEKKDIHFKIRHCANSAASYFFPEMTLDAVRIGISMYGCCPNRDLKKALKLEPVMSFYSKISSIHETNADNYIGYGMTYAVNHKMKIATIETGYADGFDRHLSNSGTVLVHGEEVPIVGRVCMDRSMLDVTEIEDVKVGDEVCIFGKDKNNNYKDLDELAAQAGTISYDILCRITTRIPKILIEQD